MARLLVSVRSAKEALAAVNGGAMIIDVKEPLNGPLGRADPRVWKDVRAAVPTAIPVSAALGELGEWSPDFMPPVLHGLTFWKLGLAHSGSTWESEWSRLRERWRTGSGWVAVAYADWEIARSPLPDRVLDAAIGIEGCVGILVDTWDKSRPSPVDLSWNSWFTRARGAGLMTALAGRLDLESIRRLAPLQPDVVAVRGAACFAGSRSGSIDPDRVRDLALVAKNP